MDTGRVEVITGCMFSGKSEELVRRLKRAVIGRKDVAAFKHAADTRYDATNIGCHAGQTFPANPVKTADAIKTSLLNRNVDVVGIDEAQFFGYAIGLLCEELANVGMLVIVAGLDMDSDGIPFGPMPALMAVADSITKLSAVCLICGEAATRTYHKTGKDSQVEVGANQYEARCRAHWLGRTGIMEERRALRQRSISD